MKSARVLCYLVRQELCILAEKTVFIGDLVYVEPISGEKDRLNLVTGWISSGKW